MRNVDVFEPITSWSLPDLALSTLPAFFVLQVALEVLSEEIVQDTEEESEDSKDKKVRLIDADMGPISSAEGAAM